MPFDPFSLLIYGLPLLLAIPLHEAAHGFVADKCGDPTARRLGRVTFNPIKHIDPIGTVVFPLLLIVSGVPFVFGWAKPVPVDFDALRRKRRDTALVAGAGPAINIVLGLASALLLGALAGVSTLNDWWVKMLVFSILLNVALALFNLLPILPLDGGRILNSALPPRLALKHARTERYGMVLVIAVLIVPVLLGDILGKDWNLFHQFLGPPIFAVADFFLHLAGIGQS